MNLFLEELPLYDSPQNGGAPEYAFSLSPTYGYPVDRQPHDWILPSDNPQVVDADEELLRRCAASLADRPQPVLAMRQPPGGWSPEGLDAMAKIAIDALKTHNVFVRFHLRATPAELLRPSVLPSIGLLELARLDVLAGAGTGSSLTRMGSFYTEHTIEECCLHLAQAGLASVARLLFVLGLPGETGEEAIETVQFAFRVALTNGIRHLRFDWWKPVPSSSPDVSLPAATLSDSERGNIRETIRFIGLLYNDLETEGPDESRSSD